MDSAQCVEKVKTTSSNLSKLHEIWSIVMTVKELIEKLQQFPAYYQIFVDDSGIDSLIKIEGVDLVGSPISPVVAIETDTQYEKTLMKLEVNELE